MAPKRSAVLQVEATLHAFSDFKVKVSIAVAGLVELRHGRDPDLARKGRAEPQPAGERIEPHNAVAGFSAFNLDAVFIHVAAAMKSKTAEALKACDVLHRVLERR